jgi:threonine/homoserine/homoserine lactone efflux protein
MITIEFLITALIVVLIPGTGVVYTVTTGLTSGRRGAIAAAFGCTAGIIPHLIASILGLSAILHMSALAFQVIKFTGAAYLLFLAWSMWRDNEEIALETDGEKNGFLKTATRGILINILNPKLTIFFLTFLPLFVSADTYSPVLQLSMLSAVFMAMTLAVFIIYGLLADSVRGYIISSPGMMKYIKRSFAVVIGFFGVKLALAER